MTCILLQRHGKQPPLFSPRQPPQLEPREHREHPEHAQDGPHQQQHYPGHSQSSGIQTGSDISAIFSELSVNDSRSGMILLRCLSSIRLKYILAGLLAARRKLFRSLWARRRAIFPPTTTARSFLPPRRCSTSRPESQELPTRCGQAWGSQAPCRSRWSGRSSSRSKLRRVTREMA